MGFVLGRKPEHETLCFSAWSGCRRRPCVRNFLRPMVLLCQRPLSDSKSFRAEQLRGVKKNFKEMRKVDQCSDEMKTVERNLLRWHVRRDGMRCEELRGGIRWEELTWFEIGRSVGCEVQVWSVKCGVWSAQCEVWRRCSLGVALHRGRAQVMFLDNSATGSHKAPTHGPGWRTAHASSIDGKGLMAITLRQFPPRLVRALLVFIFSISHCFQRRGSRVMWMYVILASYVCSCFAKVRIKFEPTSAAQAPKV